MSTIPKFGREVGTSLKKIEEAFMTLHKRVEGVKVMTNPDKDVFVTVEYRGAKKLASKTIKLSMADLKLRPVHTLDAELKKFKTIFNKLDKNAKPPKKTTKA